MLLRLKAMIDIVSQNDDLDGMATKLNDMKSCYGTVLWMAPEVVNRRNQGYGLAADIWSCTVLEMLTGQFPYTHLEPNNKEKYKITEELSREREEKKCRGRLDKLIAEKEVMEIWGKDRFH